MSVKQLVDDAISSNKITVFSKTWCPYCKRVKGLLSQKFPDVETKIIELDEVEDGSAIQQYLMDKTQQRTVPNVFFGGEHIGGCDDTFAAEKDGRLTALVKA
ncbi:glutaredoxin [Panaeolus papilionaceus]|nr:glutaredoxin [Panaeolus papilionaceus]